MRTETVDPPDTDDGMIDGMTTSSPKAKIAISIRQDLLERVRVEVDDGDAASVSAFIERAVEEQFRAESEFDEVLAESLAESGGPPTLEEIEWAERLWGRREA